MNRSERKNAPFWKRLKLSEMSKDQWERLCDGCGRCCVHKLEDVDTGDVIYTNVACRFLDLHSCRCTVYEERKKRRPDCLSLTARSARNNHWLPGTCSYRILRDGGTLPRWHPLVTGDEESVHRAGRSIRDRAVPESEADLDNLEAYLLEDERESE